MMSGDKLRTEIVACLPKRMPGSEVTVIAAKLGQPVEAVQSALLEMEGREVLRKGRMGNQHWYRGPFAVKPISTDQLEETAEGLW